MAAETRYCTVSVSSGPQHIVDFGRTRQQSETLGSRCGDQSRPWTVDALNGQRIVVSLIDFTKRDDGKQFGDLFFSCFDNLVIFQLEYTPWRPFELDAFKFIYKLSH